MYTQVYGLNNYTSTRIASNRPEVLRVLFIWVSPTNICFSQSLNMLEKWVLCKNSISFKHDYPTALLKKDLGHILAG